MTSGKDQAAKADAGKGEPSLLQKDMAPALYVVQRVLDYGCKKYSRGSWKSVELQRWDDAARRHQQEIDMGQTLDAESGLPHRAHIIAGQIIMLMHEIQACAEEVNTSNPNLRRMARSMGVFNEPPQDHKSVATAEDEELARLGLDAPKPKKSRNVKFYAAVEGDWVKASRTVPSVLWKGTSKVSENCLYRVLKISASRSHVLINSNTGHKEWVPRSAFY